MTKKDYKAITKAAKDTYLSSCNSYLNGLMGLDVFLGKLCSTLEDTDPTFNRSKFLKACGK